MQAVRQAANAVIPAVVSLFLVIGGLSLALAQDGALTNPVPTSTPVPSSTSTVPSSTSTPTPLPAATASRTASATPGVTWTVESPSASPTNAVPTNTTAAVAATAIAKWTCSPPYGWVQVYMVQPGDTLFRIASMHGVSVDALQRANCRMNTVIYVGERLWVPFALPAATELTIIPTLPTPTEPATATESVAPSATPATPDP